MDCPQCVGIERFFDRRQAEADLRVYHRHGPDRTTKILVEALRRQGVDGKTVLDIGGGIGAVHHELLKAGAASAVEIDASSGYVAVASEEAARQGHVGRATYRHANFVAVVDDVAPADVVALDRVICCYPDARQLVGLSLDKATRLYGAVYPRDTWWLRIGARLVGLFMALRRCPFRVFVHPSSVLDGLARARGFRRVFYRTTLLWQVVVYQRP